MSADPEKAMEVVDDNDHESLDEEEVEETAGVATKSGKVTGAITAEMLKNPALMQALQGRLDGVVGSSSGYIQSLPAPVKRRLKALKKLQFEATKVEAKFYEEIHELECKYHALYTPLYTKRSTICKGEHEPTDAECDWPSEDEDEELSEEMKTKANLEKEKEDSKKEDAKNEDVKGVPEFWLTIFKNVDLLQDMVQEHDEAALQSLNDITVDFSKDPMAFTLKFHFGPNEYFSNSLLTKEYIMKCEPDTDDPFSFEGPEIYKCKGCQINWKQGKNLTVKTVKKKQKHKSKGSVRTITKTVKNDSFFNFFDPPQVPDPKPDVNEEYEEVDAETQELLTSDFEVGHYIRERIIPRAVLFFTGEALEEEDFDDEDDESEEDEEDGDEEDDDEDPDFDPSKAKIGKNQQECKQQ